MVLLPFPLARAARPFRPDLPDHPSSPAGADAPGLRPGARADRGRRRSWSAEGPDDGAGADTGVLVRERVCPAPDASGCHCAAGGATRVPRPPGEKGRLCWATPASTTGRGCPLLTHRALLLWLVSALALRGRAHGPVFWGLALLFSLFEPLDQARVVTGIPFGWLAFTVAQSFGLNLAQAAFFRRYGFVASIAVRLGTVRWSLRLDAGAD